MDELGSLIQGFGVILTPSISEDDELIGRLRQIECPYIRIAAGFLPIAGHP